ncbi:hypothetical protein [Sinimarinibacterium sp. NLF-5-8]|uniref:hypothetical protein n=1 Tax=Sinimarinibacterium sp. NLF-5-8 TaxID=2698684 RepID=UPI00137BC717|nr:hypothetical protein [Sinimarinibacterium sp. NLF-5-8]QHS09097.1 hypothetical protein GT972_02315 [Sinimarinibacterium sp. NLF-5-8]
MAVYKSYYIFDQASPGARAITKLGARDYALVVSRHFMTLADSVAPPRILHMNLHFMRPAEKTDESPEYLVEIHLRESFSLAQRLERIFFLPLLWLKGSPPWRWGLGRSQVNHLMELAMRTAVESARLE